MSVIIVLPTYNERDNLPAIVKRIIEEVPEGRVLVVDDNSPDGTGDLADELAAGDPDHVNVLHRKEKQGLGAAYVGGFTHVLEQWPEVEFIIQMDADFSHDPAHLPALLEAAADADVAVGSRYTQGVSCVNWPLRRILLSKMGTAYARLLTGLPITDCTGGFKCYRAEVLRNLGLDQLKSLGYCFQIETSFRAWRLGYRLQDVPIVFHERQQGQSKISLNIALEALLIVARLGLERLFSRRRKMGTVTY